MFRHRLFHEHSLRTLAYQVLPVRIETGIELGVFFWRSWDWFKFLENRMGIGIGSERAGRCKYEPGQRDEI